MIYLELIVAAKPVAGGGTTIGYEGLIDIESFDWKIDAKHIEEPGGVVRTELAPRRIGLSKFFDPATPNLCKHLDARAQFSKATITMLGTALTVADGKPAKVMQLILSDGYIEEVSITASESSKAIALREKLTLSYATSKLIYHPMDAARLARGNKAMDFTLNTPSGKR
jgi:type VI protein secretion system component Hcp